MSTHPAAAPHFPVAPGVPPQRNIGEHPLALYILFFTEMWERFSYYGMRALLVYYMRDYIFLEDWKDRVWGHRAIMSGLQASFAWVYSLFGSDLAAWSVQEQSSQIYGLYTAFVYLTPLVGGILADRYIGQRKAVYVGGIIMALAQFTLMNERFFYIGLALLIIGNGFFKPNISTQVGSLYPKGDARRDRAFMIFYVGINLGAFLSPLICGTLGQQVGWGYGFAAAGTGMILGLILYTLGQRMLAPDNVMKRAKAVEVVETAAGEGYRAGKVQTLQPAAKKPFTKQEWGRIIALCVLCALNIVFWGVYEQQGNTLALWANDNTDRVVFGWTVPSSWFQSVNPAFIFLFTPIIVSFWKWQAARGREPSSVAKMAIGCFLLGFAFMVMMGGARAVAGGEKASMFWLIGSTAVLTLGELYLSPVGLSLVTKIAPPRIVSMMMGMWFISSFVGNYLSGFLGTFWSKMSKYGFFTMLASLALVTGLAMLALMIPLKKAIGDENASHDHDDDGSGGTGDDEHRTVTKSGIAPAGGSAHAAAE